MPAVTICPHCGTEHSINSQRAGQRVRCPTCDHLFEVTVREPESHPSAPLAEPLPSLEPSGPAVVTISELPMSAPSPAPIPASTPMEDNLPVPAAAPPAPPSLKSLMTARGRSGGQEAEMDMTPMVDVTFQLLIFFMLTASFVMQRSQQHPKPQTEEKGSQAATSLQEITEDPEYVTVRIDALGAFHVSAAAWGEELEVPSYPELLVKLRQARQGDDQGRKPSRLLVIASGEAVHDRVVAAVDAAAEVGMEDVKLLTVEDDG